MIYRIGKIPGDQLCQNFRQHDLADVGDAPTLLGVQKTDRCDAACCGLPDMRGNLQVAEFPQQLIGFQPVSRRIRDTPPAAACRFDIKSPCLFPFQIFRDFSEVIAHSLQISANRLKRLRRLAAIGADADFSGLQHVLVRRLPQIQAFLIDIVLRHRVDEIGNIPVKVNILTNPGGTDVLVIFFQSQRDHFSGNRIDPGVLRTAFLFLGFSGKDNMVHPVDGILCRRLPIAGGVTDHVGSDRDIEFPSLEGLLQSPHIVIVRDVHGKIIRKRINPLFIRHRHIHDLAALEPWLRVLGPGKLIQRQIHVEPHIPDSSGHCLMPQTERVEGARVKRNLPPGRKTEFPLLRPVLANVPIEAVQHSCVVIEFQSILGFLMEQRQEFFVTVQKEFILLIEGHLRAPEKIFPHDPEGLPARQLIVVGVPSYQHVQQTNAPAVPTLLRFTESVSVFTVVLQNHANGVDGRGDQLVVPCSDDAFQCVDKLIQLLRRQTEHHIPQIVRYVLGELVVADFQSVEQFHRKFVPLLRTHPIHNCEQPASCGSPHRHRLADLDQIGEMRCHMENFAFVLRPYHVIDHHLDVGNLDDPGRSGLQVIQEHIAHALCEGLLLGDPYNFFQMLHVLPTHATTVQRTVCMNRGNSQLLRSALAGTADKLVQNCDFLPGAFLLPQFHNGLQQDHDDFLIIIRPPVIIDQDVHVVIQTAWLAEAKHRG